MARDGQTIVFVEVKTRNGRDFGAGGEAVGWLKRRRMADLALDFMARQRLTGCDCRFDVVAIDCDGSAPKIELYRNAFDVE